jgi:cytochrome bd-type quinol oxidase subunit 2
MTETVANSQLITRISGKRAQLEAFIARAVPRKRRLLNLTLVAGTLAAALTAGPAAGGASFTAWLTQALELTSPSWRLLCGVASVCSITATVATQLLKSQNVEEQVARAQSCRAKLEVLEIGLESGEIAPSHATAEYMRCVEESSFL